ncbi:MAG: TIGR03435 family protein [Acidobacteria bacterium]|nr:TIGR03435 family protein [Acidobacteriota bacterium]
MTSDLFTSGWTAPVLNHLWQSTAVAILAWLLTLVVRNNSARVRYAIWLFASVKFLLPFQVLTYVGTLWAKPVTSSGAQLYTVVEEFTRPLRVAPITGATSLPPTSSFNVTALICGLVAFAWLCGFLVLSLRWILGWRCASQMARAAEAITAGREFDSLLRARSNAKIHPAAPLLLSSAGMEPAIFGIIRPVLLWPSGLSDRLNDAQIESIMAHELEHVRRRDNLTSAIHSLVEAIFWFHPLVRWMSSRLSEERERACDERVLEQSSRPEAYAESILKVCSFCMEPAAACVSGVSGADLKQRILRIMTRRTGSELSTARKCLLSIAALLLVAAPLGFGVLHGQSAASTDQTKENPPASETPRYEVATIKPSTEEDGRMMIRMTPDGAEINGVQVQLLLQEAFGVERDRIFGEPDWAHSKRFDIAAKVAPEDAPKLDKLKMEQRRAMLLPLLEERFGLKYHHESRELPMYSLVVAKGGPKLKVSTMPPPPPPDAPKGPEGPGGPQRDRVGGPGMMRMGPGSLEAQGGGMQFLAHALSTMVGKSVVDKTELTGNYDYTLHWTPDESSMPRVGPAGGGPPPQGDAPIDPNGPTLFTALEEQLGLKLQSEKGKVDVIVIDHIDLPTEN